MSSFKQYSFQPCEPKKPQPTNNQFKVNDGTGIKKVHDKTKHALARARWGNKWYEQDKKKRMKAQADFRAQNDKEAVFGGNDGETKEEEPSVRVLRGALKEMVWNDDTKMMEFAEAPGDAFDLVFCTTAEYNSMFGVINFAHRQIYEQEKKAAKEKGQAAVNAVILKNNALHRAAEKARNEFCKKVSNHSARITLSSYSGIHNYNWPHYIHHHAHQEDLFMAYAKIRQMVIDYGSVFAVDSEIWEKQTSERRYNFLKLLAEDGVHTLIINSYSTV